MIGEDDESNQSSEFGKITPIPPLTSNGAAGFAGSVVEEEDEGEELTNSTTTFPSSLRVQPFYRMLTLKYSSVFLSTKLDSVNISCKPSSVIVCAAKGPRPRYPRVWKSRTKIGTISKSKKLVDCIKGLSNVKEEVYGALDAFIAWELEFPLITVKKALKSLEEEKEWKRIIQVTKWMLSKGQGRTKGSYFMLLNALAEDGRLDEAEELWGQVFSENLENLPRIFFNKMISIYYSRGMHDKMFEVFADMEELGVRPNDAIVSMVGDVFQKLEMLDKYEKLKQKYPPSKWEYRYFKGKRVKVLAKQVSLLEEAKHKNGYIEEAKDNLSEPDEVVNTDVDAVNDEANNHINEFDEEVN
ncbi:hypothetical protein IFM89_003331 [Coptis chinensis]|uniref:Pentatricopeptide repeat-containing protein n=1 Tax=Coptis chinensis TaxID=261450 RepID=A0A835ITV1_9MAGN|nr:hypothetical protein IFM89_003331 [Coptis chinensis]